jgi:hypothetical protein
MREQIAVKRRVLGEQSVPHALEDHSTIVLGASPGASTGKRRARRRCAAGRAIADDGKSAADARKMDTVKEVGVDGKRRRATL